MKSISDDNTDLLLNIIKKRIKVIERNKTNSITTLAKAILHKIIVPLCEDNKYNFYSNPTTKIFVFTSRLNNKIVPSADIPAHVTELLNLHVGDNKLGNYVPQYKVNTTCSPRQNAN